MFNKKCFRVFLFILIKYLLKKRGQSPPDVEIKLVRKMLSKNSKYSKYFP
ncbi:hypothetical protein QW3_0036 [Clostridioides difficile P74]|nr:hypothetical protein HMPREF1123_00731 [Clostridioides difficile 050-P50-2011]EHJ34515.1 hypothetical protein HMPREF1122_00283 [Clostridioides difficile 002-P50-2011]EQE35851.1 hypothetical protein QC3_0023 [Clostridioides difficile CD22]EQE40549.1 hypothetical protein QC7_0088 [Clostridioides difficile CD38]EQE87977.1 hypothetical protein QCQ_0026 [Clostridioides difficile CD49]EQF63570.1 hypothetical protein QG7_0052 [Clostridioides difficile CD175]EQG24553.1 hypothetical protein QIG_0022